MVDIDALEQLWFCNTIAKFNKNTDVVLKML